MIADLFNLLALLAILATAICRINLMTAATRRTIKLAYITLAGGAFAEALSIIGPRDYGGADGLLHALLVAGIAGVLITERRQARCYEPEDCAE